jgi:LuxR family transcriptional regulator, regulator of acetate metabolism
MPIDLSSPSESDKTLDTWASTAEDLLGRYRRIFAKAAAVSAANCPKVAVRGEDRFLSDLGADADKVHGKIVSAIRDRSISDNPGELADLCDLAMSLQDIRSHHRDAVNAERLRMLTSAQEAGNQLSPSVGTRTLLERAAKTICDLPGIERAMVFRREGETLRAAATVFVAHNEWARDCQAHSAEALYDLAPQRPETLMVQRRSAGIVTDAMNDPNAFQPIVHKLETTSYVGAPVIAFDEVIATIHGDAYFSGRAVDQVDRDVLATFASSLGPLVERAMLMDHLRLQQHAAEQMSRRILGELGDLPLSENTPSTDPSGATPPWQTENEVIGDLTRREYEILQLMTRGATNADIGRQLFLADGTVKSHVKHILRKFGVANRGQAVATYLDSLDPTRRARSACPPSQRFALAAALS